MAKKEKKLDSAEEFKQRSLEAIARRKKIAKFSCRILMVIAVLMMAAVLFAYLVDV